MNTRSWGGVGSLKLKTCPKTRSLSLFHLKGVNIRPWGGARSLSEKFCPKTPDMGLGWVILSLG